MMKALAAMRGPLSFTAVEFCKCQHQTVVDLVDLAGMESLVVPALKAVQVAQALVLRAGEMTGRLVRAVMTTALRALVVMMIARVVGLVGMMRVHVSVVMMIVQRVHVAMTLVQPGLAPQPSSERMRFVTRVVVAG